MTTSSLFADQMAARQSSTCVFIDNPRIIVQNSCMGSFSTISDIKKSNTQPFVRLSVALMARVGIEPTTARKERGKELFRSLVRSQIVSMKIICLHEIQEGKSKPA